MTERSVRKFEEHVVSRAKVLATNNKHWMKCAVTNNQNIANDFALRHATFPFQLFHFILFHVHQQRQIARDWVKCVAGAYIKRDRNEFRRKWWCKKKLCNDDHSSIFMMLLPSQSHSSNQRKENIHSLHNA